MTLTPRTVFLKGGYELLTFATVEDAARYRRARGKAAPSPRKAKALSPQRRKAPRHDRHPSSS